MRFYQEKLRRLLADRQLCCARLNAIDEAVIDGYKQRRTPASVNRELATLRRFIEAGARVESDRSGSAHPATPRRAKPGIRAQPWARAEIPASCTATAPRCCDSDPGIRRATRRSRRPPVDGRVAAAGRASEVRVYRNTGREVEEREAQPQSDRARRGNAEGPEGCYQITLGLSGRFPRGRGLGNLDRPSARGRA